MASGCIIWHGAVQSKGYPSVVVPGRGAHQPRKLPQVALIRTTKNGKPLFRVRWNYRDRSIDGKAYDEKDFRRETDALRFDAQKNPEQSSLTERVTVHEVCQHRLAEHVSTLERRTVKHYTAEVRLRINPHLGTRRMASLTAAQVNQWRRSLLSDHSANSSNKALAALKAANRWARSEGISTNRSFDDVALLPTPRIEEPRPYTPSEVERIANGFPRLRDRTLVLVAAYTGLRWSELVALEWPDIQLDHPTQPMLEVRRSLDIGRGFNRKAPKSGASRVVPILAPGVEALRVWGEHATDRSGVVFPSRSGTPLGTAWYAHDDSTDEPTPRDGPLGRARKASGIKFTPHQLRDTFASIMIAAGIGEIELSEMLAHRSLETTRRHYGRLFAARRVSLAGRANDILDSLG